MCFNGVNSVFLVVWVVLHLKEMPLFITVDTSDPSPIFSFTQCERQCNVAAVVLLNFSLFLAFPLNIPLISFFVKSEVALCLVMRSLISHDLCH